MKHNYVMMSWEKMARKNCDAEHDGCCFFDRNCWNVAVELGGIITLFSFPTWQAEMKQQTTSFYFVFFFLNQIMSGFVEWVIESLIMKIKQIHPFKAQSLILLTRNFLLLIYILKIPRGCSLRVIYMMANHPSLNM